MRGISSEDGTGKSDEDDACGSPSGVRGINSDDDGEVEYNGGTIGVYGMAPGECGSSVGDVSVKGSVTIAGTA